MMHAGKRAIEHAEAMVALECDMGIRRIQEALGRVGRPYCRDCGEPIELQRRAVLPSAERCASCQHENEMRVKRGW